MESVCLEIGISWQHVVETSVPQRYQLICDKQWLQMLEKKRKIAKFPVYPKLDRRAHPAGELEHPWCRIIVQLFKKQPHSKVYPLKYFELAAPTATLGEFATMPQSYSQAVFEVMSKNFKNLWEASYAGYSEAHLKSEKSTGHQPKASAANASLIPYDLALKDVIQKVFKCPIIHCKLDRMHAADATDAIICNYLEETTDFMHCNIMPALICIETSSQLVLLFYPPCLPTSLYDCITYSPAIMAKNFNKPLFLMYQLLQLYKSMHSVGLLMGEISLQDILLKEDLWLQIIPQLEANIFPAYHDDRSPSENTAHLDLDLMEEHQMTAAAVAAAGTNNSNMKLDLKFSYDLTQFSLRDYCEMWCNGMLSNFDYLTILNNAAGRSVNSPAYHHIMPWVSDFSSRAGANWRDLTKSKYRINKGDTHLDLMFQQAIMHHQIDQPPHHVSDSLSEITYFVYMARRTPQHILREHVRPIWVPAEYPASIQRLQEWTPDECIPEFYSDPMIFKSIHEDLADLEIPKWASCPEDFVCKHREALESQYVSERLQHWIDLNFGYKLSGKAAIKSKNVCLSLVDQHKNLCQRGIVQLFTQPHPSKRTHSVWFGPQAPRLQNLLSTSSPQQKPPKAARSNSSTRRLAKSTEQLNKSTESLNVMEASAISSAAPNLKSSPRLSLKIPTSAEEQASSSFYRTTNFIELPKDYNPVALLQSLEATHQFINKTFPHQKATENAQEKMLTSDLLFEDYSDEHSFTNQLFTDADLTGMSAKANKPKSYIAGGSRAEGAVIKFNINQLYQQKKLQDLQILACIMVELFAMAKLRPLIGHNLLPKFQERLKACQTMNRLHRQDIPKCLRNITDILLNLNAQEIITELGLPVPTAQQLLEPIYSNLLIPFPISYYPCYALIRSLQLFDFNSVLLELNTHFHCNGSNCSKYTEIDRLRVLYERKIAKCKVMSCCAHLRRLLDPMGYEQFPPVEILMPHIIDLLYQEHTSILAAWNLFDALAQALGMLNTQKYLLHTMMKLYDVESFERGMISVRNRSSADIMMNSISGAVAFTGHLRFSTSSSFKSRKSVKLYHQIFLLRLIVRFGLKCFLQHFIAPLIEAVGGYKEPEDGNGLHYHSSELGSRRTSRNLSFIGDATTTTNNEEDLTLMSPEQHQRQNDETDENTLSIDVEGIHKPDIDEVFSFDDDANSDHISTSDLISNKSIDSFDMRPTTAEEAKEEVDEENDAGIRHSADITPEKLAISEIIFGSKISNNSFEESDKISLNSQSADSSMMGNIVGCSGQLGPKSPTIAIPSIPVFRRSYQLNTIDCDIGSRKSVDSFEILQNAAAAEEEQKKLDGNIKSLEFCEVDGRGATIDAEAEAIRNQESLDSLQASVISKMSEEKSLQNNCISEMSSKSLVWLSHRLGPVLTSRYITKNLLKMLTLCYVGQENLLPETETAVAPSAEDSLNLNYFSVSDARVVGDRSASRVLECLMAIAALYGEQVILLQYFPHISELIALGIKRITGSLEGALISTLQLMKYLVPCLMDSTIMDHLKDLFLDSIILPLLRFLASTRFLMPSGYLGRSVLARKLLDCVYVLGIRIGPDMTREHLSLTVLRPFFLIFDKAFGEPIYTENHGFISPISTDYLAGENKRELEEIRDVFGPALAHCSYLTFLRYLGEETMKKTILNLEFILTLCHEFEQPDYKPYDYHMSAKSSNAVDCPMPVLLDGLDGAVGNEETQEPQAANSFGTQIVGNRIDLPSPTHSTANKVKTKETPTASVIDSSDVLDMVAYKFEYLPKTRYLKGNWLAYWRHEITRSDKDNILNLKQIKLQSFLGHSNSVRALLALDNENSFISASKDKTVKLWSLRSEGDGTKTTNCQFTYTAHRKSIHSLAFLEAMRFVVSCDSGVHIWDPFIGRPLGILDTIKHNPITVVRSLPSPSPLILAGTAESSVKIIDSRSMQYVNEWRVNANGQNNATVRCLTVAPSGNWLAVGLSSGSIVMLDTRTGMILNAWRPMECDLLQLAAPNDQQLISSALDHSLAVWNAYDGILHYQLQPPAEPAHFLQTIDSQLVYATTGNRIGVYSDLSNSHASHSVTKLRSETFRGVLTSLAVLPLNHSILAGNESGVISLLC